MTVLIVNSLKVSLQCVCKLNKGTVAGGIGKTLTRRIHRTHTRRPHPRCWQKCILYRKHRITEALTPYTIHLHSLVTPSNPPTFQTLRLLAQRCAVGCCVCWMVVMRRRQGTGIIVRKNYAWSTALGAGSSVVLMFLSSGACLRICHLLWELSHHHRCEVAVPVAFWYFSLLSIL